MKPDLESRPFDFKACCFMSCKDTFSKFNCLSSLIVITCGCSRVCYLLAPTRTSPCSRLSQTCSPGAFCLSLFPNYYLKKFLASISPPNPISHFIFFFFFWRVSCEAIWGSRNRAPGLLPSSVATLRVKEKTLRLLGCEQEMVCRLS